MGVNVLQGYGATELGPLVSFTRKEDNRIGTVGQAVGGVEMRIAEDGEVMVRSPGVFKGYWEDPERTAEVLQPDGWYHTGDIGEISADGFLTLRGRKKDMLAMPDGTKVYPEDIEAVLEKDHRVREVTVVGFPAGPNLKIHAVLVMDDPSLAEEVIRDANAHLGAHQQIRAHSMWPDEDFPRTHTLKVKKREVIARLEADAAAQARAAAAGAAATNGDGAKPMAVGAGAPTAEGTLGALTALVASIAELPVGGRPARRAPVIGPEHGLPPAGRAAGRDRGGDGGLRGRRRPRTGDHGGLARRAHRRRPRRLARHGHPGLAAEPGAARAGH